MADKAIYKVNFKDPVTVYYVSNAAQIDNVKKWSSIGSKSVTANSSAFKASDCYIFTCDDSLNYQAGIYNGTTNGGADAWDDNAMKQFGLAALYNGMALDGGYKISSRPIGDKNAKDVFSFKYAATSGNFKQVVFTGEGIPAPLFNYYFDLISQNISKGARLRRKTKNNTEFSTPYVGKEGIVRAAKQNWTGKHGFYYGLGGYDSNGNPHGNGYYYIFQKEAVTTNSDYVSIFSRNIDSLGKTFKGYFNFRIKKIAEGDVNSVISAFSTTFGSEKATNIMIFACKLGNLSDPSGVKNYKSGLNYYMPFDGVVDINTSELAAKLSGTTSGTGTSTNSGGLDSSGTKWTSALTDQSVGQAYYITKYNLYDTTFIPIKKPSEIKKYSLEDESGKTTDYRWCVNSPIKGFSIDNGVSSLSLNVDSTTFEEGDTESLAKGNIKLGTGTKEDNKTTYIVDVKANAIDDCVLYRAALANRLDTPTKSDVYYLYTQLENGDKEVSTSELFQQINNVVDIKQNALDSKYNGHFPYITEQLNKVATSDEQKEHLEWYTLKYLCLITTRDDNKDRTVDYDEAWSYFNSTNGLIDLQTYFTMDTSERAGNYWINFYSYNEDTKKWEYDKDITFDNFLEDVNRISKYVNKESYSVSLTLSQEPKKLNIYNFEIFEAYTRGKDFSEYDYTTLRAEETNIETQHEASNVYKLGRRLFRDTNYFNYKYSGRNFDISGLKASGNAKPYLPQSPNVLIAMVHSKDVLQESDITLGDTYAYNRYFIEAIKYKDNDTKKYKYKDTFTITDFVKSIDDTKYVEEDLEIKTGNIDLLQCQYYKPEQALPNNKWYDCAFDSNNSSNTTACRECLYQKNGYCPYRFETEKHPRRIRTLSQEKSNRFNLIQETSKVFEIYPHFYIEFDDNGRVIKDEDGKMKKHVFFITEKGKDQEMGFRYEKNLNSVTRTVDSNSITTKLYVENVDSDLSDTGLCSIQTASDNLGKNSYILNFNYYTMMNLLDKEQLERDLYGIDSSDLAFLTRIDGYNNKYDDLSNLIINTEGETMTELQASNTVNVTGITTALEERQKTSKTMYQFKVKALSKETSTVTKDGVTTTTTKTKTSYTTSDSYKSYLTKFKEYATIIWSNVESLFISNNLARIPVKYLDDDDEINIDCTIPCDLSIVSNNISGHYWEKTKDGNYPTMNSSNLTQVRGVYDIIKERFEWTKACGLTTDTELDITEDNVNTFLTKYCKGELLWRILVEGFKIPTETTTTEDESTTQEADSNYIPFFDSWQDLKTRVVDKNLYESCGTLGQYRGLYNQVKYWKTTRAKYLNKINDITDQFYKLYEPYIKEGTWTDSDYLTDNEYYWAGVSVLDDSCKPQISYSITVSDISPLPEYKDDYTFELADTTYVEDIDFFGINEKTGLPNKQKVLISAIDYDLDTPSQNSITVQNYTTSFEELFEQITATVQSLTYNENTYKRASNFTSTHAVKTESLQGTLDEGDLTLVDSNDSNVVIDDTGAQGSNITNSSSKYKLTGEGLYFSKDGGTTWDIGVGPSGINADYIKVGQLDVSKVQLMDNNYIYFLWDKSGITAYRNPATSTDGLVDFTRFNKYGLSLVEKENVRLRAGYEYRSAELDNNNNNTTGDYLQEADLTNQNIGFYLYNDSGIPIFKTETRSDYNDSSTDYSARLSMTGEMFITNDVLANESTGNIILSKSIQKMTGAHDVESVNIIYCNSSFTPDASATVSNLDNLIPLVGRVNAGTTEGIFDSGEYQYYYTLEKNTPSITSNTRYVVIGGRCYDLQKTTSFKRYNLIINYTVYPKTLTDSYSTETKKIAAAKQIFEDGYYMDGDNVISVTKINQISGNYYTDGNSYYGQSNSKTGFVRLSYSSDTTATTTETSYELKSIQYYDFSSGNESATLITSKALYHIDGTASSGATYSYWDEIENTGERETTNTTNVITQSVGVFINNKKINGESSGDDTDFDTVLEDTSENEDESSSTSTITPTTSFPVEGIDVSHYQGTIDFAKVKAAGKNFVIMKIGEGEDTDSTYNTNYTNAKAAGLSVGGYWMCTATTKDEAEAEAQACINAIEGKSFEYPIYYDVERDNVMKLGAETIQAVVEAFEDKIEEAGFYFGLYSFESAFENSSQLQWATKKYTDNLWVANFGIKDVSEVKVSNFGIWQYSESGTVDGISVNVDLDRVYVDLPSTIANAGKNNLSSNSSSSSTTDTSGIMDAISGGAGRIFTVCLKGSDSETNEPVVKNIFSILKNGLAYFGGDIKNKNKSNLSSQVQQSLEYLPDDISIVNPTMIITNDGTIICDWDNMYDFQKENGNITGIGTQTLMQALQAIDANTAGGTSAASAGYYFIDPLST